MVSATIFDFGQLATRNGGRWIAYFQAVLNVDADQGGSSSLAYNIFMRSLGGIILLAGIGVALFVYLPAPVNSDGSFDRLQRVAASRCSAATCQVRPASGPGSFSPTVVLSTPARPERTVRASRPRQLPHRHRSRRKPPSPATRRRVGRRRSSPPQRLRQLSLRRAIPMHATSSCSTSSSSCDAPAAIGAA